MNTHNQTVARLVNNARFYLAFKQNRQGEGVVFFGKQEHVLAAFGHDQGITTQWTFEETTRTVVNNLFLHSGRCLRVRSVQFTERWLDVAYMTMADYLDAVGLLGGKTTVSTSVALRYLGKNVESHC